ncbi:unnamed protein product, partial [Vitis vinifera]
MTSSVHNFVLDWPTRLQIAIGPAKGLCHMHEYCSVPIIHRDVKSSNILLDAEFKAKIVDFGLAKTLVKQGEPNTMSGIVGSYRYIAPEYAYTTKVNKKIDVYSFGVVLLELVTGREPNNGDEHMCLAEWALDQFRERKTIEEVVDEEIKEQCDRAQVATLFKLGIRCTNKLPSNRSTMKETITKKIPARICDLKNLIVLDVSYNYIPGEFPDILNCSKLEYLLLLQNSFFNGTWPTEIGNLSNLEQLAMAYNDKFRPSALPKDFNNLSSLELLDLSNNKLEALNLKEIDLSDNHLTGSIPAGFGKLQNLTGLNLFWNQLSGEIPANISLIPTLETFKVFSNQLMVASNNNLSGEVPTSLGNCTSLLTIQLSNNRFSGGIPSGIWTSPDMVSVIVEIANNNNNMLSGKIPVELTSLWNITVLLLDGNQFSGELPSQIISWKSLNKLNLSRNKLSGLIPKALGSLTSLSYLDLSENQFSGQIPPELGHLNLIILHLSSNQLCVSMFPL